MRNRRPRGAHQLSLPGMPEERGEHGEPLSRRGFLSRAFFWVAGTIAAALGIPAVSAAIAPALRSGTVRWSPIGRLGDPEPGQPDLAVEGVPILTHFTSLVEDAYLRASPRDVAVYVVNHGGGEFTVYDIRCTHLGCPVTWEDDQARFYSPCHGGAFDAEGRVTAGPPPRPLDRYEYKVEDGVLFAGALYEVGDDLERAE